MHEVLVYRLGGLSLPRKSVVRLTDRPDMTLDVYRGHKTTIQPTNLGIISQYNLMLDLKIKGVTVTYISWVSDFALYLEGYLMYKHDTFA